MNILIVGAGNVGRHLCLELSSYDHNIFLIEKNEKVFEEVIQEADITGFAGSGVSYNLLVEAGAQDADCFIAVTDSDELNIISSIMAKKLGSKTTLARVRSPEYAENLDFVQNELGINLMINPEFESAKKLFDILKFPSASSIESFMDDRVKIAEFTIRKNNPLKDMAIKDIDLTQNKIIICLVEREGESHIPNGDFVLREGDKIHITGSDLAINEFTIKCKYQKNTMKSALIVGGGQISYYLISLLKNRKMDLKLIEINEDRAEYFARKFPYLKVINADGTDHQVLLEERFTSYDALIANTQIDEENIILSLHAISEGVKKNITKIHRDSLYPVAENLDLDTIISPKRVIADTIIKFVKSLNQGDSSIERLQRLDGGKANAMEFSIKRDSPATGVPLSKINIRDNLLIICIKRGDKIIYPGGDDFIKKGDRVLLVSNDNLNEFTDILR